MQETYYDISRSVVAEFKRNLRSEVSAKLTSGDEDALAQMIAAAIAEEVNVAVGKIEAVAKELRDKVGKPDLGM